MMGGQRSVGLHTVISGLAYGDKNGDEVGSFGQLGEGRMGIVVTIMVMDNRWAARANSRDGLASLFGFKL